MVGTAVTVILNNLRYLGQALKKFVALLLARSFPSLRMPVQKLFELCEPGHDGAV